MKESSTDPDHILAQYQAEAIPIGDTVDYGTEPSHIICQNCQADIITGTYLKSGKFAILSGVGICLIGGVLGCCIIPCVHPKFKDTVHECPNCGYCVGRYKRMSTKTKS